MNWRSHRTGPSRLFFRGGERTKGRAKERKTRTTGRGGRKKGDPSCFFSSVKRNLKETGMGEESRIFVFIFYFMFLFFWFCFLFVFVVLVFVVLNHPKVNIYVVFCFIIF